MNEFLIITTVLTLIIGVIGAAAAIRANTHAKYVPYAERQFALRGELKRRLSAQNRLARTVKTLEKSLPSSLVNEDLGELRSYLRGNTHAFVAPTPGQLALAVKSIDEAIAAMDVAQHEPRNDTAFDDAVEEIKCNVLRPALEKALNNINVLLQGIVEIEKKPMSVRKQIKQFKGLEP